MTAPVYDRPSTTRGAAAMIGNIVRWLFTFAFVIAVTTLAVFALDSRDDGTDTVRIEITQ